MLENAREFIMAIWLAVAAVWLFTAFRLKPIVRTSDPHSRVWEILILTCAAALLFSQGPPIAGLDGPNVPAHAVLAALGLALAAVIDARVLAAHPALAGLGIALTAGGASFAILARLFLGRNWSASATIKANHEIVRRGPYALVRHPIYTGQLVAVAGTAIAFGEIRDLLALALVFVGFWLKARSEERLLMSNFGDRYAAYRRDVRGAIVPFVL
jgi:protein-S-isoprenylcysteine O-methyltransferase Ste14